MAKFSEILAYYTLEKNRQRSFYAFILHQLKVLDAGQITPTLAVGVRDRRLCLFVNTEWVESTPVLKVMDVIDHEAVHIIANHIPRWLEIVSGHESMRILNLRDFMNIAADLAVNSFLVQANRRIKASDGWLLPAQPPFDTHKPEWTFEQHLAELLTTAPRVTVCCGTSHPWHENSGTGTSEIPPDALIEIGEHVKVIAAQAKDTYTRIHGQGSLPGNVAALIEALLAPPKIDWRELMRSLAQGSLLSNKRRSLQRPYRRHLGIPALHLYPGRSSDMTHNIVMCIDTSGSMGEAELSQALGILEDMVRLQTGLVVTVIESDAGIGRVYTLDDYSGVKWSVTGRGGTCFDPAIEEAGRHDPDIVFYYTDGYASVPTERVTCPMVWLIAPNGKDPCPEWGHHIYME